MPAPLRQCSVAQMMVAVLNQTGIQCLETGHARFQRKRTRFRRVWGALTTHQGWMPLPRLLLSLFHEFHSLLWHHQKLYEKNRPSWKFCLENKIYTVFLQIVPESRPRLFGIGTLLQPHAETFFRVSHVAVYCHAIVADPKQRRCGSVHLKQTVASDIFDLVILKSIKFYKLVSWSKPKLCKKKTPEAKNMFYLFYYYPLGENERTGHVVRLKRKDSPHYATRVV